jgi:cobalamin biosynthesis Mg chelatase CobN
LVNLSLRISAPQHRVLGLIAAVDSQSAKLKSRVHRKRNASGEEAVPIPRVEDGKWSKERERTKSGRWRKKRSDANKPRNKKSNAWKYALGIVGVIVVVFVVVVLFFPEWLGLPQIIHF